MYDRSDDDSDDSPIPGMDKEVFKAIMEEERADDMRDLNPV